MQCGSSGVFIGDMGDGCEEDPSDCDPFSDGDETLPQDGQEPIFLELSAHLESFPVDDVSDDEEEGEEEDVEVRYVVQHDPIDDIPELPRGLDDVDDVIDVTATDDVVDVAGDNEYPVAPLQRASVSPVIVVEDKLEYVDVDRSVRFPNMEGEDVQDDLSGDEEVWAGEVRVRGQGDELGEFEPADLKRQRLLGDDDDWGCTALGS